ncbi:MAG: hypothetical protein WCG55_00585 [bacterium]
MKFSKSSVLVIAILLVAGIILVARKHTIIVLPHSIDGSTTPAPLAPAPTDAVDTTSSSKSALYTRITTVDGYSTVDFSRVGKDAESGPNPQMGIDVSKQTVVTSLGTAQLMTEFSILDVCDVRFDRIMNIDTDAGHIELDVEAVMADAMNPNDTVSKIVHENPSYFEKTKVYGCGDRLIWKKNGRESFYSALVAGKTGPISQAWFKTFDTIFAKIRTAKTANEAVETINAMSLEASNSNTFTSQPAAIQSIVKQADGTWQFAIDLLSRNPHWLPGGEEGFFLNLSPVMRHLVVTNATKTYVCGGNPNNNNTTAELLEPTAGYVAKLQSRLAQIQTETQASISQTLNAYMSADGTKITALYDQCLP